MLEISKLRKLDPRIITIGSYPSIIQSILDFDYLSGRERPSIVAILAAGRKFERYFFGQREVLIPVYESLDVLPTDVKKHINLFICFTSARRVYSSIVQTIELFLNIIGGTIFAENVPEKHAIEIYQLAQQKKKFIVGPSSVGLIIPATVKLGAIGGVHARQLVDSHLFEEGNVAVLSASGGMTNEIIRIVAQNGKRLSFALSFGGDRFPITTPKEAFLLAQHDPKTSTIVYFGELGGFDEYEIAQLLKAGKVRKPVICYIAGVVSEIFAAPPQFGHAKAMAKNLDEGAREKRESMKKVGAQVAESFAEFVELISRIPPLGSPLGHPRGVSTSPSRSPFGHLEGARDREKRYNTRMDEVKDRRRALIVTSISKDEDGVVKVLGEDLLSFSKQHSFAYIAVSLFLGRKVKSRELEEFVDFVLRIMVEHGPYVSGAVNTIVASRAGRDLVSSLSAGLLTIGPRFGGAINQAAANWLNGVLDNKKPFDFVEAYAKKKVYIAGIGHRKYRVDFPDPRVGELLKFSKKLKERRFTQFAQAVEKITVAKKGNLILNVDGAIAAILLDLLSEKERLSDTELKRLVETEFFNALFVLSRSVGFIAHFLDQKRLDEGLLRLDNDLVVEAQAA